MYSPLITLPGESRKQKIVEQEKAQEQAVFLVFFGLVGFFLFWDLILELKGIERLYIPRFKASAPR